MLASNVAFLTLALVGHAAFWVGVINRWHAVGLRRPLLKSVAAVFLAALVVPPLALADSLWKSAAEPSHAVSWQGTPVTAYLVLAAVYGAVHLPVWALRRWQSRRPPQQVRSSHERVEDIAARLADVPARGFVTRLLSRVPLNEIWKLHVREFEITIAGLDPRLDGLSICHLSDLHMSGRIGPAYYREVSQITNDLEADLVALTGDVCDRAACIDWIGETLGPLEAPHGKFFVLGNHDARTHDVDRLRRALGAVGFQDVSGRWLPAVDGQIVVAGDERPWFPMEGPFEQVLASAPQDKLRLLLSHTPDHLRHARAGRVDLMLAGHTHGGQVHFPLIGPVLCPSLHGTRYSSGFHFAAPTLLHVSRGAASLFPVRIGCPPEITMLTLRVA